MLIRKAVRGRWNVSQASRIRLVDVVLMNALNSEDDWLALSACQTAVTMTACDQVDRFRALSELRKLQRQAQTK